MTVAFWYKLHKYISFICMLFLLLFCITGLPLIFKNEIREFNAVQPEPVHTATPYQALWETALNHQDAIAAQFPDDTIRAISITPQVSRISYQFRDKNGVQPHYTGGAITYYADTDTVKNSDDVAELVKYPALKSLLTTIHLWHVSLNLGIGGMIFLGFMCLFSLIAIISGVILYGPFMRTTAFGEINKRTTRSAYLGWHKFLGMVTAIWASLLCLSGISILVFGSAYIMYVGSAKREATAVLQPTAYVEQISIPEAFALVQQKIPDKQIESIDFPNPETNTLQYTFYLISPGNTTGVTEQVACVSADAQGQATFFTKPSPAFMSWSSPLIGLHIGNHDGLVLRIIWAVLDVLTIVMIIVSFLGWRKKKAAPVAVPYQRKIKKPQSLSTVWKLPAVITLLGLGGMILPLYDFNYAGTAAWLALAVICLHYWYKHH